MSLGTMAVLDGDVLTAAYRVANYPYGNDGAGLLRWLREQADAYTKRVECSDCAEMFPPEMTVQPGGPGAMRWCVECFAYSMAMDDMGRATDEQRAAACMDIAVGEVIPVVAVPVEWLYAPQEAV